MHGWMLRREDQHLLERVREFVHRVVLPVAEDLDRHTSPADCFSWAIVEEGSKAGLRTLTLRQEDGGVGADSVLTAAVVEELARGDLGVSVIFAQTLKIAQILQRVCTPAQAERFILPFAQNPRGLLAIGITEPETSSNYIVPFDDPQAPFGTTAVRRKGAWVLDGKKHFISNGNRAMLYLVFAHTDPGKSLVDGSTCFLVPHDAAGFTIGRVHDKMGERLANNAELLFAECPLTDEHVLGEVHKGFEILARFFPASNAYAGASVLGVAEAAYTKTVQWVSHRVQGGKRLIDHDTTAQDLAEMRMLLDAARAYIRQAAYAADHPELWDPTLGALPKVFASRAAWQVVTRTLELHGGYGYMREAGVEKLVRDAAAFLHSDGANRSLLLKASRVIQRAAQVRRGMAAATDQARG